MAKNIYIFVRVDKFRPNLVTLYISYFNFTLTLAFLVPLLLLTMSSWLSLQFVSADLSAKLTETQRRHGLMRL